MTIIDYIQESFWNLKRKCLRTFVTIICIAFGIFTVMIVMIFYNSSKEYIESEFSKLNGDSIVITNINSNMDDSYDLHVSDKDFLIKLINEIVDIQAVSNFGGNLIYQDTMIMADIYGIEDHYLEFNSITVLQGRFINEMELQYSSDVIVISDSLAMKLFQTLDCLGKFIELKNKTGTIRKFEVIGIYENPIINNEASTGVVVPNEVFVPITSLQRFYNDENVSYLQFKIVGKEEKFIKISNKVVDYLELRHNVDGCYYASNSIQARRQYMQIIDVITTIFTAFGSLSIILGGVNLANVLLISIKERYREIGIRKAVGATNLSILIQFMIESLLITLAGGGVGNFIAIVLGNTILENINMVWEHDYMVWLYSLGFNVVISVIFGLYPAYKATRLTPFEAFRID